MGNQMTTSSDAIEAAQDAAKRNLWLHFTRMSAYEDNDVPVIVRGSGLTSSIPAESVTWTGCPACSSARSATA